ncbi:ribose-phosphate pyrophosphokinase-like domain-containing protein [Pelagicoccus sp. SDUM812003]|uniref:ribose-phosphate diphosphokinase n=1 Tax=Pelagicoccus sp. SDUM812003 TaxID=3041267 RepID=UPI00280E72FC|nr:ribose-phosphate pyrophosphokinase-like domain-containing protein [Pelagicoccus sp. SDUM812003]MDQ8203715.1 ribose-phosphate pyrophosphokinase-like domain-containing protein [Pelagicoccus sp. SDUM812003]
MKENEPKHIVVGNSSDDPFAIDVAFAMGQLEDVSDMISMKLFANSEFCPRFISDENDRSNIGNKLQGKSIIIVSTSNPNMSRQSLAMRTLMIARAAKENGASKVTLVEPDLYYSAQDRGARPDLGETGFERDTDDLKKFDGQPFTAKLYAEMLKLAGVDRVVTVHNHSTSVQTMFTRVFEGQFYNLIPYDIYVDYLLNSNIVSYGPEGEGLALCAPDKGARDFVREIHRRLGLPKAKSILLDKERTGEREVEIKLHAESEDTFESISGHDVVLFDDMVRTGSTVVKACQFLRQGNPGRTVFALTHFYASGEGRVKMANTAINEILTLNTIPTILNRDVQGRLRKKLVVLKIEKWIAQELCKILGVQSPDQGKSFYQIDMSSKNLRWKRKIWLSEQLQSLKSEG